MRLVKCPEIYYPKPKEVSIFLAGGISNCPDWQTQLSSMLNDTDLVLVNPRRDNFPINDPKAAEGQIKWEHSHLRRVKHISFWFPKDTLCPITLYECGYWLGQDKSIVIGVHPEYKRKIDVEIQTKLVRPSIEIVYSLKDLSEQLRNIKVV